MTINTLVVIIALGEYMSCVPRKGQVWLVDRIIGRNRFSQKVKVIRDPDLKFVHDNGTVDMFENVICEIADGESKGKTYFVRITSFIDPA
jgi:hypothetical protein